MKKYPGYGLALALIAFFPLVSGAETVVRTGESISIETDQVVENDFYVAASSVSMSGEVRGDMYSVGASVTTNGPIGSDLTVLGGSTQIHSEVKDDVRAISGEVVIAEHVGGDVFVIGGLLKILSSATIDGDVFFYGGEAEISGEVKGSLMGTAESIRVDAPIGGSVDVVASRALVLGDRANITGDVRYESISELTRAQQAVIQGEVLKNSKTPITESVGGVSLVPFLIWLFGSLCLFLFFKEGLQKMVNDIFALPARAALIGMGALFISPVVLVLLMVTVLGFLVGLTGLFALIVSYLLAIILLPIILGSLLLRIFNKTYVVNLTSVLLGALLLLVLSVIPVIGPLLLLAGFVLGLGGLFYSAYITLLK